MKKFWSKLLIGILTMVATLGFSFNAQAAPIGGNPNVNLSDYQAGNESSYLVRFNATSGVPASGRVDVTFNATAGSNADISQAELNLLASSIHLGSASQIINGNTIQVRLGADGGISADEDVVIQFDSIFNAEITQNYTVTLSTYDNLDVLIDGPTNSNEFTIQPRAPSNFTFDPASPQNVSADVNQLDITAHVTDEFGNNVIDGTYVNWQSSNSNFTFDPDNQTIIGNGQTTVTLNTPQVAGETTNITASSGAVSSPYVVNVIAGETAHIVVQPSTPTNVSADTHQITISAYLTDEFGNPVNDGTVVDWTASNPAFTLTNPIASVNGYAYVTLNTTTTAGDSSTVTGTANGFSDVSGLIAVTHGALHHFDVAAPTDAIAGVSFDITITARDQYGNIVTDFDEQICLSGLNDSPQGDVPDYGGTITFVNGVAVVNITGYAAGVQNIIADYEGITGASNNIDFDPGAIDSIVVSTTQPTEIIAGQTVQFEANGFDQYGNGRTGDTFTWTNADGSGLFTNTTAGVYPVYASCNGINSNTINVTVSPAALDHIIITPSGDQNIYAGETIQFSATGYDQYNNPISGLTFTWDITTDQGLFDSTTAGVYPVRAHVNGIDSNLVNVTVNPGEVAFFEIVGPNDATAGVTFEIIITAYDNYGNIVTVFTDEVTLFGLSNSPHGDAPVYGTVTFVDGQAYVNVTGFSAGMQIIGLILEGELMGISNFIDFAAAAMSASIQLTNPSDSIETNSIYQFKVKVLDTYGNEITNPTIVWSVTQGFDNSVIDQFGRFVAVKAGTYTVKAQYLGTSTVFTFTVKDKTVAPTNNQTSSSTTSTTLDTQATQETTTTKSSVAAASTSEPEKPGEIKGTEVTTIGAEDNAEESNGISAGMIAFWIVLGLALLGFAYYAYAILGATEPQIAESVKPQEPIKDEKPKLTPKNGKKIAKDTSKDIQDIDEIKDDNLRW